MSAKSDLVSALEKALAAAKALPDAQATQMPPKATKPTVGTPAAPAAPKQVDWDATGRATEEYHAVTGRYVQVTIYADGTREGPELPTGAIAPVPAPEAAPTPDATPAEPSKPSVPASSGNALARALAFHQKSVFNVNWERERFARFSFDATVRDNYKDVGIGGVRGFIPMRPGGEEWDGKLSQFWDLDVEKMPTKEQFNRFKPNAKAITDAGLIVMLDLLDECPIGSFNESRLPAVKKYLADACGWVLEWGIDPALICVGPVNEYRGGNNAEWQTLRFMFDDILKNALGDKALRGMAPAYWGHHSNFTGVRNGDYAPDKYIPGDDDVINFWHAYDRNSKEGWASVQSGINAWRKANGNKVVMCGEIGPGGLYDGKDFAANDGGWVEHIDRQNPALADSVPNLWACTDGDWTMNRGYSDARLWVKDKGWEPEIEQAVRRAVIANRKARGL